jgi:unsaturated rhamnogalacturonyl hydrolase
MNSKTQSCRSIGAVALLLACWTDGPHGAGSALAADTSILPAAGPAKAVLLDAFYNRETKNGKPFHYTWEDTAPSGFSKLGAVFAENGARLEQLAAAPTEASLRGYSVYIIVDPDIEAEAADRKPNFVDAAAADAVARWVEAGGTLLLLNNNKGNADFAHINILAGRFGITFNEDSRNETPKRDLKRATVDTRAFASRPFFRDVPAVYMKEVCTLGVKAPAEAVLTVPQEAGSGTDVLMAASRLGKGRVVAVGDPWLYNEYIDFAPPGSSVENHKAAVNLVRWLLAGAPAPGPQPAQAP